MMVCRPALWALPFFLAVGPTLAFGQDRAIRLPPQVVSAAGKRVALVIGNNDYPLSPLKNATGDARLMAKVLTDIGFKVEPPLINATALQIERALRAFAGKLEGSDVGVFYYAGHGIAVDGKNYLLGVDFSAEDELEARHKAVEADLVADRMEQGGARLNLIVLDACRNNPFKLGRRAEGVGLGTMQAGRGMLIAMATAPGKAASDNPGGVNGLFTQYLAQELKEPGVGVKAVFDRVKAKVIEASGGQQRPWVHDDVVGDVALVASKAEPAAPEGVAAPVDRSQMELAYWNSIKDSKDRRDFEAYLDQVNRGAFGGTFRRLAENRLADSKPGPGPATSPPPTAPAAPPRLPPSPTAEPLRAPAPEGYLELKGAPGTQVFIDGKEIGRLPFKALHLEDALFLTEGSHEVRLVHEGYEPVQYTVAIRGAETTQLFVDLGTQDAGDAKAPDLPPGGRLELSAVPDTSLVQVFIDGKEVGTLPLKAVELSPGKHSVSLLHPLYQPLQRIITIRAGETAKLSLNFREEGIAK